MSPGPAAWGLVPPAETRHSELRACCLGGWSRLPRGGTVSPGPAAWGLVPPQRYADLL